MKPIKQLAQYYVDLLVKLGLVRFSMLLAIALVALAMFVQIGLTLVVEGRVHDVDIVRSIFFGLLVTPWAVYFLSVVVDQLEESRQRLTKFIHKLEVMRERDLELNAQLKANIELLNEEIEVRRRAEQEREAAFADLEAEVFERERAQLEAAEQSLLLRSFLDASPDIIYYRNEEGVFSGCNRALEEMIGMTEQDIQGLTPHQVYTHKVAKEIAQTDAQVFATSESLCYEQWMNYPDGRKVCMEISKTPLYGRDGHRMGVVGFGRDITERKRYQEALEKASQEKTTFIATISHELKTPLNGIVGLSRMLLDTPLSDDQRNYIRTINISAITLGNIFNDLIDIDKFDRRRLELRPSAIDFHAFVADMENMVGLLAEEKGLHFQCDQLTDLPHHIEVDSTRLRQVLWNLLSNAIKFTPEGNIDVRVSAEIIGDQAELEFEVEDTGIGIPKAEQDKIFAMYYQVKSGKNNLHAMGTGIGLSVSRQLIEFMGGEIILDSEEGEGSRFVIRLTVPVVQQADPSDSMPTEKQQHLRVFMVEDVPLNVTIAQGLLESLGHSVTVAMTGEEALAKFEPEQYDLVLLDIQLPDITGLEVAERLHQRYASLPPLIALTANVLRDQAQYREHGIIDVVTKPLSVKSLRQVIHRRVLKDDAAFTETDALKNETNVKINMQQLEAVLDLEMLESYVEIVGVEPMLKSIDMFEAMMPDYLALLEGNLVAGDQQGITSEAHKMKGAASSIGLKHLQQVAQKAQSPDHPAWWENINSWVDEIKSSYQQDVELLRSWLAQQEG
ncbi:Aerobic respiration control sensor protein ArcB [Vibrio stylophorae]|uniref:Aerobic respiration control sensor protein n=1 Tax=Vibrio stylophorae TaxID=659351 RepID=A0ABM8ZRD9_9VIBR|nr:aerobic respiration two-component sensor histidine kinase ArcB [Vibrio stylophorae]CAH0532652.1 Aerobic respiration control sensor protein ArcB [Vibrio stylophorae]